MEKAEGSFPKLRTVEEKQGKEDKAFEVVKLLSITQRCLGRQASYGALELQGNKEWPAYWDLWLKQRTALLEAKAKGKSGIKKEKSERNCCKFKTLEVEESVLSNGDV